MNPFPYYSLKKGTQGGRRRQQEEEGATVTCGLEEEEEEEEEEVETLFPTHKHCQKGSQPCPNKAHVWIAQDVLMTYPKQNQGVMLSLEFKNHVVPKVAGPGGHFV